MMPTNGVRSSDGVGVPDDFDRIKPGNGVSQWRACGAGPNSSSGSGFGIATECVSSLVFNLRIDSGNGRGDTGDPEFLLLCTNALSLQAVVVNLTCRMRP